MNMPMTMTNAIGKVRRLLAIAAAVTLLTEIGHAAAPGISGAAGAPVFNLTAQAAYISQPDGQAIYSWGYGCDPAAQAPKFLPSAISGAQCSSMQIPGPTLIVTEGDQVTVNLTNGLPKPAGNTSILFPGFQVTSVNGVSGLLAKEAAPGGLVTYTFTAANPGTHSYYSGTQGDLQIEMGLFGALIVLPKSTETAISGCTGLGAIPAHYAAEQDFRLASAAYNHSKACYDREYLFQFSEIDPAIHSQALEQISDPGRVAACTASATQCPQLTVATEPYHPAYFMINGRSMPDDMDPNYALEYPHQPYNGNPHMHPGEQVLLRVIGQGRWQHPFHTHANHVRVLGRDGNLILSSTDANSLAGPAIFTTATTPGQTVDGIFYFTGRGLNWDMYGHNPKSTDSLAKVPCVPDVNGYYTSDPTAINYYEWCQDHNKPLESAPFGDVGSGGPMALPDVNILTNGAWFGGSPYLGADATVRATGPTGVTPPSGTIANSPNQEAGFAFMWHSHNEREITTNNAFPGGMMMMMLVDSREYAIDESN
jgi:FtsP/CotA-like multicopper oxidase with cupredoxin domain